MTESQNTASATNVNSPEAQNHNALRARLAKLSPEQRARLRQRLDAEKTQESLPEIPATATITDTYPLTQNQRGLWALQKGTPELSAFNSFRVWQINGPVDEGLLEKAISHLVLRHPVLRTKVGYRDDTAYHDFVTASMISLETRAARTTEDAVGILRDIASAPFDHDTGPLTRFVHCHVAPEKSCLMILTSHLVTDGWSMMILADDLSLVYTALATGASIPDPRDRRSFLTHAQHDQASPSSERLAAYIDSLKSLETFDWQPDKVRPDVFSHRGAAIRFAFDEQTTRSLETLAASSRVTPYMVIMALLRVLLFRYTGQRQLGIATASASRPGTEHEHTVGFFSTMVVYPGEVQPEMSLTELLNSLRDTTARSMQFSDIPLNTVIQAADVQTETTRYPLAQIDLLFYNHPNHALRLGDIRCDEFSAYEGDHGDDCLIHAGGAKNDLNVQALKKNGRFQGIIEFNSDIYDRQTIQRMADHLRNLACAAALSPTLPVSKLDYLEPRERQDLVDRWAPIEQRQPGSAGVYEQIQHHITTQPDTVAIESSSERVTYAQLGEQISTIATELSRRGIGAGDGVGLYLNRAATTPALLLAIFKLRAFYIPIDTRAPAGRIAQIFDRLDASIVVADGGFEQQAHTLNQATVTVDTLLQHNGCNEVSVKSIPRSTSDQSAVGTSNLSADPDAVAYIIHTSGSTGTPKAIVVQHHSVSRYVSAIAKSPGFGADDSMLVNASLSFDTHVTEIFMPLCRGGRCVVLPVDAGIVTDDLRAQLDTLGVTHIQATPGFFQILLKDNWDGTNPPLHLWTGAERAADDLARALAARATQFWNLYGPTEAMVYALTYRIPDSGGPMRIGEPIDGVSVYLLDNNLNPVPTGVVGEICIGGNGLTAGYFENPELTERSFVPNPFGPNRGRLYRTGDLAIRNNDGSLELLGRNDDQIKILGVRIEPGEIESCARALAGVDHCVVQLRDNADADPVLACFFVAEAEVSNEELATHLRRTLPSTMQPQALVKLDALPFNTNGKLDRAALAQVSITRNLSTEPQSRAANPSEQRVIDAFCDILPIQSCSPHESFFDLGGNSMLGLKLADILEVEFDTAIPLTVIFDSKTPERIAHALVSATVTERNAVLVPLNSGDPQVVLHFVHGITVFAELAESIGNGIQINGSYVDDDELHDGGRRVQGSEIINRLANEYVEIIRASQAVGPYNIAGLSFGGIVAFEIARRLEAAGEQTRVIAFDTRLEYAARYNHVRHIAGRLQRKLAALDVLGVGSSAVSLDPDTTSNMSHIDMARVAKRRMRYLNATRRHQLTPVKTQMLVVKAEHRQTEPGKQWPDDFGWGKMVDGNVTLAVAPGDHLTHIRGEGAATAASAIRSFLL